jgi:hypothetical protein
LVAKILFWPYNQEQLNQKQLSAKEEPTLPASRE